MGRCRCNGGRGGTSRIRYIYTVYVTKSTVILKNSIGIIVVSYSEKATAPHSSPLARKIPWTEEPGRSPVGRSPRCRTESERRSDFPSRFPFHALEKDTATHRSVLAWRTPGTAGPGGLPSMGSHRLGHD